MLACFSGDSIKETDSSENVIFSFYKLNINSSEVYNEAKKSTTEPFTFQAQ